MNGIDGIKIHGDFCWLISLIWVECLGHDIWVLLVVGYCSITFEYIMLTNICDDFNLDINLTLFINNLVLQWLLD